MANPTFSVSIGKNGESFTATNDQGDEYKFPRNYSLYDAVMAINDEHSLGLDDNSQLDLEGETVKIRSLEDRKIVEDVELDIVKKSTGGNL
jgi:hypothetical protein